MRCWGYSAYGQLGAGVEGSTGLGLAVDLGSNRRPMSFGSGAFHTCAVLDNGTIKCWGLNGKHQLGYAHTDIIYTPASDPVTGITGATAVVGGLGHTCALLNDGSVKCWGANESGQLGRGTTSTSEVAPGNAINLGGTATAIVAGSNHTCARLDNGVMKCWGDNAYGQLGIESTTDSNIPVTVLLGGTGDGTVLVQAIAASGTGTGGDNSGGARADAGNHTCAIVYAWDFSVWQKARCWGNGSTGQLGQGSTSNIGDGVGTSLASTGNIDLGFFFVGEIKTGGSHTCARLGDTMKCWGLGTSGQLGNSSWSSSSIPVSVVFE